MLAQYMAYLLEIVVDTLRLVLCEGYGKVLRQNGVGVYEQLKVIVHGPLQLLLGAVILAQEAGSLGYDLLVNACSGGSDTGWIVLRFQLA